MKTLTLTLLSALCFVTSFAAPKKYKLLNSTSSWSTAANWLPTGVPTGGDTVVIPASKTLTMGKDLTLSNVYIDLYGALVLTGNNLKFILQNASTINVHTSGWIDGDKASQQIVLGNIIFKGDAPVITGPKIATSTSKTFVPYTEFTILPVTFLSFNVSRTTVGDYLLKWTTADEVDAARYEVERSANGTSWKTIATLSATGFTLNTYTYTDKNAGGTVYYRIKQIDTNGTFMYTSVIVQKSATATTPVINTFAQKVQVQFPPVLKGSVSIEVISLNGMVLAKQTAANGAASATISTPALKGLHIVRVSNSQGMLTAKQVLL